ncbi:MAG: C-type lectin domain-containing protein [Alphaproteobacteria bacterium]|nr:C-type lectin domain-containing protein [Alphaproteobacteria bacterium]
MSFIGATMAVMMTFMQGVDETGTAVARPIGSVQTDSATGSKYQIFEFYGRPPHTWEHARRMVKGYIIDGREGQLATVKDVTTHYFLILNFPEMRNLPMWIGLYAQCNETAELFWADDTPLADQAFRGFADGVARKISRSCTGRNKNSGNTAPIYYQPDEFGVRWQMGSSKQNLQYMMVEFPKPKEEAEAGEGETGETQQP